MNRRKEGQRGDRERENPKQAPRSAWEPDAGLDLTTLGPRPEPKSRVRHSTD